MTKVAVVTAEIYADPDCRNFLAVHGCRVSPTVLGDMEIEFLSEHTQVEFLLRYGHYLCTPSTI